MKFLEPRMQTEFQQLPEPLREKLVSVDAWLKSQDWPDLLLTGVGRTADDSERIYTPYADKLVAELKANRISNDRERVLAGQLAQMPLAGRRSWARGKFSWHRFLCAVDIRNRAYSRSQRRELMNRLRNGTNAAQWELLEHDVGRGDHIHVAFKDFSRRKSGEQATS